MGISADWLLSPITPSAALKRRDPSSRHPPAQRQQLRAHQVPERICLLVAAGTGSLSGDRGEGIAGAQSAGGP
jgi:hypothetical protein